MAIKQTGVTLSTTVAEYVALDGVMKEVRFRRRLKAL